MFAFTFIFSLFFNDELKLSRVKMGLCRKKKSIKAGIMEIASSPEKAFFFLKICVAATNIFLWSDCLCKISLLEVQVKSEERNAKLDRQPTYPWIYNFNPTTMFSLKLKLKHSWVSLKFSGLAHARVNFLPSFLPVCVCMLPSVTLKMFDIPAESWGGKKIRTQLKMTGP